MKKEKRIVIHRKIRMKVMGSASRPRLCVFKSANHMYAQLIDDQSGRVLAQAADLGKKVAGNKTERSHQIGKLIAGQAKSIGIESVVFDRGGFQFHGRIKALAQGAREGGLKF